LVTVLSSSIDWVGFEGAVENDQEFSTSARSHRWGASLG